MKKILYFAVSVMIAFTACKKDNSVRVPVMETGWQKQLNDSDYAALDLKGKLISEQNGKRYWQFCFKDLRHGFLIVEFDSAGIYLKGRFINLDSNRVVMQSIKRVLIVSSAIAGGYIAAWHNTTASKETIVPVITHYDELPEFVVVGTYHHSTGISFGDYMNLQLLFGDQGTDGPTQVPVSGSTGGSGGASGNTATYTYTRSSNGTGAPQNVNIGYDNSYTRPDINLDAWMKCFTNITDAGSNASITLYGDLPVDSDPGVGLNIWNGNTGHCFLQLNKTNGTQSVSQVIGFTAQSAGKAILNASAFVAGKIVDNAGHKYNCSITMNLSVAGLNTVIDRIKSLSDMAYSIVNYDCLDFALDVINAVRPANPLIISKSYDPNDPFSNIATGPKLYTLLGQMVNNGSPETNNIIVAGSVYAGVSHGPCN